MAQNKKKVNIPNILTVGRIWAIPLIVATFFFEGPVSAWIGVVLFTLAGITDYMDGYLARHLNQVSCFSRFRNHQHRQSNHLECCFPFSQFCHR